MDPAPAGTQPRWPPAPHARVYITATLDIRPREYEHAFWRSATWLECMRNLDMWFLVYATVNTLLLQCHLRTLRPDILAHLHHFASLYLALAILHSSLAARGSPSYFRWRTTLLVVQRAARFVNVLMDMASYRACAANAPCAAFILQHVQRPGLRPLGATLRSLMMASCVGTTLIHTSYLRFPFKPQVLAQLAYVIAVVRYTLAPCTHVLGISYFAPSMVRICSALDRLAPHTLLRAAGVPVAAQNVCESQVVTWNVLLFVTGLVGFVLPLTVAYCEERRTKLQYIRNELQVPNACGGHSMWDPVVAAVKCGVLLVVYTSSMWGLVRRYHVQIAHWVVPVHWPGSNMTWYHTLVPT